eukprot:CAMPEP_0181203028 /NCGR_PEP_ID=MMETSP1096-20121128/19162_1 /TAXON_ID=156174 ORGANISM="Chrysochromulina ericina, Strain CCMP281" /NCGR_SAMPLE_ID=MMETSP1096 /ASSEMBLY_ACC=CAM_ASM_000453 /LENGTH=426 /DNA_ID=CAMNT_0023293591 /DNA_START=54 /DNA_END=1331 /DNA_ORIENTATION=-
MYREGAFGGAAATMVNVLDAHKPALQKLRADRAVDAVIALTHQDQAEDEQLAASSEYAAVLAGHDHDLTVTTHGLHASPVVKAGSDALTAVVLDLLWGQGAPAGSRPAVSTRLITMSDFDPDPALVKLKNKVEQPTQELLSATLAVLPLLTAESCLAVTGGVPKVPSSRNIRFAPCTMAMYLAGGLKLVMGAEMAIVNSGAVRGDRDYVGCFTYADLQVECPFPSEIVLVSIDGAALIEAIKLSRRPWMEKGGPKEASNSLQHDLDCFVDERHILQRIDGRPVEPRRIYKVAMDSYDITKDPVISRYVLAHPDRVPSTDAGRPMLTILVEFFCRELWRELIDKDHDGDLTQEEIDLLFDESDTDHSGEIAPDELHAALAKRLGGGASRLVSNAMITFFDEDENGSLSREELKHLAQSLVKTKLPDW